MGAMNRLQWVLTLIEARLQAFIEGGATRLFPGGDCTGLAQRLAAAMQEEIQSQPDGTLLAPNVYTLIVHPSQECMLPERTELLANLAALLQRSGEEASLVFLAPPVVRVILDAELPPQEIQVMATFSQASASDTSMLPLTPKPPVSTNRLQPPPNGVGKPPDAFLIVSGSHTVPVPRQGVTIGRQPDLSLVIDNPHISRVHAQIRLVQGRYVIFDLDSRAGTYVNGQRVMQCALHPGDVISLAGVQLVFGQEPSGSLNDTQEIHLNS
jgi:hypothetical protein